MVFISRFPFHDFLTRSRGGREVGFGLGTVAAVDEFLRTSNIPAFSTLPVAVVLTGRRELDVSLAVCAVVSLAHVATHPRT